MMILRGFETVIQGDEYGTLFCDGHDFIEVDLPDNSALSVRAGTVEETQWVHGMCDTHKRDSGDQFESSPSKMKYILAYIIFLPQCEFADQA